jgi:CheY-like chemotaxis protein
MPRILVVEDDPQLRPVVVRLLQHAGYDVAETASGAAALQFWRESGADMVLTDIKMAGMSGIEVILQLRAHAPTVPIVAMSGVGPWDLETLRDAHLLGAVGILQKPFTREELLRAVANALSSPDKRQA